MRRLLLLLSLVLLVSHAAEDIPCSNFGLNWSAENRCLRALLTQCRRAASSRGIRTVDPYYNNGYSRNYIELPSSKSSSSKGPVISTTQLMAADEPNDLKRVVANFSQHFDEKLKRLEAEHKRKLDIIQNRRSWYDAEEDCIAWGGHLVSIADANENDFVRGILRADGAWIGLNDIQRENQFVNSDQSTSSYRNFQKGEPDNANYNENCVEMRSSGEWTDAFCLVMKPFVCKR
ncbi:unnamed protein product [Heligmosomoides polygyrus]|uniref:C-type lectin domain-containing protein n=1 Tax=Heligmosomoides polygyrus TaxID=6339 RepID=A0A3P8DTG4_HELPZ|nr:unnamed protein product [Heligmosomoides polygyrus]